ncbi:MAG: bifunctional acetaldehyde-CoA/alcohol dehydrogenase [Clostridiales bacterium]|nr:bifunctional acetaldehyde-CoA/alcohol dehydrogenase [Eubacteriales bacterium]MDH7564969.1 bifunctional acetaldehyde-CoA/alcohol dehydrogenase [Clostridiales bacterium]
MEREEMQAMVERLVSNAVQAQEEYKNLDQESVDRIVKEMTFAGIDRHMELAKLAVDETQMGIYEDKVTKNLFATEYVYHSIKYDKTVGIVNDNEAENYFEVAEPVGVIAGVTPVTNPTSTTLFKSLICVKTRNPIIFSFHPRAQRCSSRAAEIVRDAAVKAGAPKFCIQWIEQPTIEATKMLMNHPDVSMVLATGGASMVHAAYSTGKPALGVGPGNVPCYIEKTANIKRAVADLILSKTFDNGMICASEQALIVDREIADQVISLMRDMRCYFLSEKEIKALEETAIDEEKCAMNPRIVGQPAYKIAEMSGFSVPRDTKILVAQLEGVGPAYPLSREKLSPIIALYVVSDYREGIRKCEEMTEFGGLGHTAVIHSEDDHIIHEFSRRVRTGRLIVNSPSSQGAIGDLYNNYRPSLTLGCGTMGRNSTTQNVSTSNLINIKRVAKRTVNMKWFKIPPKIYFEPGSLAYLSKIKGKKAFVVTDSSMVKLGLVDRVFYHLEKAGIKYEIFQDVEPDPSVETVYRGVKEMNLSNPDIIIAFGGGSAIDAAKGMWLFYEYPDTQFEMLRLKFMDIRKRAVRFPDLGKKARLIAIPTTAGTGSEITAFAVITDKVKGIKYPLADYELTPDISIIDPELTYTVPRTVTADTGMDVLTHSIEAYVSVMASDYTDALAIKSIQLVFEYLPRAYKNPEDKEAREKMANASTMAGMAFTNAFLGINHSMAHNLGANFHIPHGRANAILLPYVIEYNASRPTKFIAYPKYEYPRAGERYAEIARALGLKASTAEEGVRSLIEAVYGLMRETDIPFTLKDAGIKKEELERSLDFMANNAFADQCTGTNPRMPLVDELKEIYLKAYGDRQSSRMKFVIKNDELNPPNKKSRKEEPVLKDI